MWIILDMDQRPNFVIQGGFKLPIGYRFRPTDEELVVHYLKRKVFSIPFPASVIPEFDVFQTDPWGLPGLWKSHFGFNFFQYRSFFCSSRVVWLKNMKDSETKFTCHITVFHSHILCYNGF